MAASTRAPSPPPSASEAPAPATSAAPLRYSRSVWTTPPDSDECREYSRATAPEALAWESRELCEKWVKERGCRPGHRCFDGCNWRSCTHDGRGFVQTDMACGGMRYAVEFEPRTANVRSGPTGWPTFREQFKKRLKNPKRRLRLIGYAEPDEATSKAELERLARRRAEKLRQALVADGIAAKRLLVELGDAQQLREAGLQGALNVVHILDDPAEPIREDFEPDSPKFQKFCGAGP